MLTTRPPKPLSQVVRVGCSTETQNQEASHLISSCHFRKRKFKARPPAGKCTVTISRDYKGFIHQEYVVRGKAIPLPALTDPEGSRRLRLPDLKTIGT
jgi:hypothetical protein